MIGQSGANTISILIVAYVAFELQYSCSKCVAIAPSPDKIGQSIG